ncbi:MAG: CehA/McbA family metallohydrolase [Planctomycetaceae bacterium]
MTGLGAVPAADLSLHVVDHDSRTLPCRVLVRDAMGECHTPVDATLLEIGPDRWFMSEGRVGLSVPAGRCQIRIEHGLEFERFKSTVLVPDAGLEQTITLDRWINMRELGYLCGENHLHVDTHSLGPMAIAEGLDFGSSLTWWNGHDSRRPVPSGDGPTRRLGFAGREITASVFDAELEHTWGAAYVQYLPQPFPLPTDPKRPNLEFLSHAVDHGAIVHYQAGWSREVILDALLGLVHTVNVCNNNFHMHRFQPRSRYSNLLDVDGFPIYPDTDEAMMQMNTDTWYRLLNLGLKLSAGAGSATGVKQVPVGFNRTYVRVDPDTSLKEFNEAWKLGRNFVTNGPVILLRGPDEQRPGDEIEVTAAPQQIEFSLKVLSDQPLQNIELVQNGEVVKTFAGHHQNQSEHRVRVHVTESCWIAARCTARDDLLSDRELQQYDNPPRQRPSNLRFAHTSPVYVAVNGTPVVVRHSVQEGLLMLDRLQDFANEHAAPDFLDDFTRAIRRAQRMLKDRLKLAAT